MTTYSFIDESGETRLVGTISPAPGGGSQTSEVVARNGLLGVLAAPPVELLVMPDPLGWKPLTAYSLFTVPDTQPGLSSVGEWARPTGDTTHSVQAQSFVSLRSGATEPLWPTNGDGIADGAIQWDTEGEVWTGPWQATTALSGLIIKNGHAFISDDGGNSGGSEPDWTTAPNYGDTVTDGAITWTNSGVGATWAANTLYTLTAAGPVFAFSWVLPTGPTAGVSYVFSMVGRSPTLRDGTSGSVEPAWDTTANDYTTDDNLSWVSANTSGLNSTTVQAIITGFGVPTTSPVVVVRNIGSIGGVRLEDVANVVSELGTDVEPGAGEGIDNAGTNLLVTHGASKTLVYENGAWLPVA